MRTLASRALAAFGRIDVLVCSAGIGFHGSLEDTTPDVVRRLLEVNVIGTLNAARAVVPYFEAQRAGHLIVIGSIAGKRGIPGYAAYSAAKFAQTGLAEALRAELRGSGIAVTTVVPVSVRDGVPRRDGARVRHPHRGPGPSQTADDVARAVHAGRAVAARPRCTRCAAHDCSSGSTPSPRPSPIASRAASPDAALQAGDDDTAAGAPRSHEHGRQA